MPVVTTRGKGFEEEIVKLITDTTGLPASTSIRSAIRALAHLGIRMSRCSRPIRRNCISRRSRSSKASGFNVVGDHTEDVVFKRLQDVPAAQIAAAAKRLADTTPTADGIYLPCNQWIGVGCRRR